MRQRLLYATAWRDLRWPFVASLIFVIVFSVSIAASFQLALSATANGDTTPEWIGLSEGPQAYARFLDALWFRVPSPSFVLAIAAVFIASGAPPRRNAAETSFLMLLPVSRRKMVLARFGVLLALLAALCLVPSLAFVMTGRILFEESYPLGRALLAALLALVGTGAFAGLTVAVASFMNRALAAGIVLTLIYLAPLDFFRLQFPPRLVREAAEPLNVWAVTDPALWGSAPPLIPLVFALTLAIGGPLIAAQRLGSIDV